MITLYFPAAPLIKSALKGLELEDRLAACAGHLPLHSKSLLVRRSLLQRRIQIIYSHVITGNSSKTEV